MKEIFKGISRDFGEYTIIEENSLWHNEHGPAITYADGYKSYYIKGSLHRENGPATIEPDGTLTFYIVDESVE